MNHTGARRDKGLFAVALATGAVILENQIVCANAQGYAVAGKEDATLTYLGRAEHDCDNSAGLDGVAGILVRNDSAFLYQNSPTDPIGRAHLFKPVYVAGVDVVAASDGGGTRCKAGVVVEITDKGVWVE